MMNVDGPGSHVSSKTLNDQSKHKKIRERERFYTHTHMHGHKPMEITSWVSFVSVRQRLNLSVPLAAMPPGDTQPSTATMGDTQAVKVALNMLQSDS